MRAPALFIGLSICLATAAHAADEVLFSDDFATLQPGWGQAGEELSVADNKLVVKTGVDTARIDLYRARRFHDVDLRVDVVQRAGAADQAAGPAFWASDYRNYYAVLVQADGSFYVGRNMWGKLLPIVPLQVRDAVRKGLAATNRIRVVTSGDTAVIYVNDQESARFKGSPPPEGGFIGVRSESGKEVCTWEYSGLSVRRGPPAADARPRDPALLYAADFTTLDPAWGEVDEARSVRDGKLVLSLRPDVIQLVLCQASVFGDIDLAVDVGAEKGDEDQPAGVVFWASNYDNLYVARIRPNGGFSVGRKMNGQWVSPVLLETNEAVRTGLGQTNKLRVVTSGRWATVFVNDRQVARFRGVPPDIGGKIGVYGESGKTPGVWTFSNLTVRPGPPPLASDKPADESIIFADDFTFPNPGWGRPDEFEKIADGKLQLTMHDGYARRSLYQAELFTDADVRVSLRQATGTPDQVAGLIFWASDPKNYCAICVRSDGGFILHRKIEDQWKNPSPIQVRSEVRKGVGEVNELRVVAKGSNADLYVNGRHIGTYESKPPIPPEGGWKLGLYATAGNEPCTWEFTNLVVRKPK